MKRIVIAIIALTLISIALASTAHALTDQEYREKLWNVECIDEIIGPKVGYKIGGNKIMLGKDLIGRSLQAWTKINSGLVLPELDNLGACLADKKAAFALASKSTRT